MLAQVHLIQVTSEAIFFEVLLLKLKALAYFSYEHAEMNAILQGQRYESAVVARQHSSQPASGVYFHKVLS
jgi:hypothetical protein